METKKTEEKKKTSEESEDDDEVLDETISKAQDMGEKIGDIREQKPVNPETALPPSTSAFLREGNEAEATHETSSGGVEPELESKIVEKNITTEKSEGEPEAEEEPDSDLIEHQRDFDRKSPPRKPAPKETEKRPLKEPSKKPAPKVESRKPAPRPPPRPRQVQRPPPVSNIPVNGKFQPAVAGVADTNLKKCPQCGGFVNLAVSKSCFNCGYDIK